MTVPWGEVPEPPETGVPGWWWQVLGSDSNTPVMGAGRADRKVSAQGCAEAQMDACEGSVTAMVIGPGGVMHLGRRTAAGDTRWTVPQ